MTNTFITERDIAVFEAIKDLENEYEAIIKANTISNYESKNVINLYVLKKYNYEFKGKAAFPLNIVDTNLRIAISSMRSKQYTELVSKYRDYIYNETGFDLAHRLSNEEIKVKNKILKNNDSRYAVATRVATVNSFCKDCMLNNVVPTIDLFIRTIFVLEKIADVIIKNQSQEIIFYTSLPVNLQIIWSGKKGDGAFRFFDFPSENNEYPASRFRIVEQEYGKAKVIFDDINRLYDIRKYEGQLDLRFEFLPAENKNPELKNASLKHIESDKAVAIPRNNKFRYYGLTNMPVSQALNCTLPEFAGVYILRDEDYRRYVGQGKNVIQEAINKLNASSNSLVAEAAANGMKFWIEDFVCGYEDGRPLNLNEIEAECIKYYQSHVSLGGYNRTWGNTRAIMYKGNNANNCSNHRFKV